MRLAPGIAAALLALAAVTAKADDGPVDVMVEIDGEIVRVEASFHVSASAEETWQVMTDFEHMAKFISNLKSSSILSQSGNTLTVTQKGEASVGFLSFAFESTREIRLTPFERIQSHMLSGNMKRYDSTTQLTANGSGTHVQYHTEAVPNAWIPPVIGARFIENETREQLQEMRNEILRRQQQAAGK